MSYNFLNFKQKIEDAERWLAEEFKTLRTGKATPSILDSILVESYGAKMPIKQMASITIEDPKTIRVSPWNNDQIKEIEKAILNANLGISVSVDEKGLRIIFPALTGERREVLIKITKERAEKAKVSIRGERDEVWSDIQERQKEGEITEDEKFKLKTEMQRIIDEANLRIDGMINRKEGEIKS